jgi:tetratricopeptide (TPR) repeat protein
METRMNRKDQRYKYDSKVKGSGSLSGKSWLYALCLTLLPLRLLTSLMGTAYANPSAEPGAKSVASDLAVAGEPDTSPQRQLWRADISLARGGQDEKSKTELVRMIEQVRSVKLVPRRPVVESVIVPVEAAPAEPNQVPLDALVESEIVQDQKPKLPYEPISDKTIQMLRDLSKDPGKVDNPLDLAETLFLSGNMEEASLFYTEALARTEPNDVGSSRYRAWALYQTGNCLRKTDPAVAMETYTRLVTEYPDSPWSDMAAIQARLIDWYLKNEPHKLVANAEEADEKPDPDR